MAQCFIPEIAQGDKRILVVGGEILASSLRLPPKNSWKCYVALGGQSVVSYITDDEITSSINNVVEALKLEFNAELR